MSRKNKITLIKLVLALLASLISTALTVFYLLPAVSPVIGSVFLAFASLFAVTTNN